MKMCYYRKIIGVTKKQKSKICVRQDSSILFSY